MEAEALDKLRSELRRGAIVLAVLVQLREEHYGYSLRKALAAAGIQVEEGTLYPLVRRLEKQGLLVSEWREEEKRKKRFYSLSPDGRLALDELLVDWNSLHAGITRLLDSNAQTTNNPQEKCDATD